MKLRMVDIQYGFMRQLTGSSFTAGIEFPAETGCLLLLRRVLPDVVVVAEVLEPEPDEIVENSEDGLVFSRSYLRRALLRVREYGYDGIISVHTHPLANDHVNFSSYDNANDPGLMGNLQELAPSCTFGSMVLGRNVVRARTWNPEAEVLDSLSSVMVFGERVRRVDQPPPIDKVRQLFDRSFALTGQGALAALSGMKIGLVGAGGTGSLMAELLVSAGAGEIQIFDFDVAEDTNLNRVLHLRAYDVARKRPKAERLKEALDELGLPTVISISRHGGDIRDAATALELAGCDLIVGCVDRDWPRLVMSEIAYRFLVPLIDLGTEITASDGEIQSIDARVSSVGPGRPCLMCSKVVSPERIRVEGYSEDEQARQIATGYCADTRLATPAVMDLNMRAASLATLVIRHLLQPFLSENGHAYRETVTSFRVRAADHVAFEGCPICGPEHTGTGQVHPLTVRPAGTSQCG